MSASERAQRLLAFWDILRSHAGTLRFRLAIAMVVVVALLGGGVRYTLEYQVREAMERELDTRSAHLARYLAAEVVDGLLYNDLVSVGDLLFAARKSVDDLVYVFILDPSHQVVVHTFSGAFPSGLLEINRFDQPKGVGIVRIDTLGLRYRDIAVPIHGGDLGMLHLGIDDHRVQARIVEISRTLFWLLLGLALLSAAGVYLFTDRQLQPLTRIVEALHAFVPGRARVEIPPEGPTELARTAEQINLITARLHQAQMEIEQTSRLAATGRVASVVAHELGNPLASMVTRLALIERSDDQALLRSSVPILREQLGRIQRIAQGLSGISRGSRRHRIDFPLLAAAREAIELVRFDPRAHETRFEVRGDDDIVVHGDRDHFIQALTNILLNGIHASGPGGWVRVETVESEHRGLLQVCDSGPGVPPEAASRIFEPFYTTRKDGTGLGLPVTRNLMRHQGGDLELVDGPPGCGACFRLSLPLAGMGGKEIS